MPLEIIRESHLDHHLSQKHIAWLLKLFADRSAFFLETVTLPDHLGEVECGLFGPCVGDAPVDEKDVTYVVRGSRRCASRMVDRPTRLTRTLTVIAGPGDDKPCVLYTSYGGPSAPREPGDAGIPTWEDLTASRAFWAIHALSLTLR